MKVHLKAPVASNGCVNAQAQRNVTNRGGKYFFCIDINILVSNFLAQQWRVGT
jgi:hypothetical protein